MQPRPIRSRGRLTSVLRSRARARAALIVGMGGVLAIGAVASEAPAASPVLAAFPGSDGRIAYDLASNIWTVMPDGAGAVQLTWGHNSLNPRWSPDGTRLAFNRYNDLWTMNADGSHVRRVTNNHQAIQPSWSPDGNRLAYIALQANGHGDVAWINVSGGTGHRLTHDAASTAGDSRPTWSPRGGIIVYQRRGTTNQIRTVNVTTGAQRLVTQDGVVDPNDTVSDPDFRADGSKVMFLAMCDAPSDCVGNFNTPNVMSSNLDGSDRVMLSPHSCGCEGDPIYSEFAAAPDGQGFVAVVGPCVSPWGGFCGIEPGSVLHAIHPDWQPLPVAALSSMPV
jgi:dipeptidyl aminopeptidase/acylaminoacyl peptidase